MGFWSNVASWVGNNIIGVGQGIANAQLTNRQLAETELNNQFNRDLATKNYEENIKNNEFNRNLASANMQETLKNNEFNRNLASENMAESKLNNSFNRDMAQKTYDFQKEQYENGVLNQAKQYEALGISPSAILGGLSNMPSMSNSQASSSGFGGASTSGFGGANTNSSNVQANVNGSNLQYSFDKVSSLLAVQKQKAEIENLKSSSAVSSSRASLITNQADYQKMINDDEKLMFDFLHANNMNAGMLKLFKNMDFATAGAIGVVTLINQLKDWQEKNKDKSFSEFSPSVNIQGVSDAYQQLNDLAREQIKDSLQPFTDSFTGENYLLTEDSLKEIDNVSKNKKLSDDDKKKAIDNIITEEYFNRISGTDDFVNMQNHKFSVRDMTSPKDMIK